MRMWLYPYLTWATTALIVFVLGYMLTDTEHDGRKTVLLSLLVAAVVVGISLVLEKVRRGKARAELQEEQDSTV